MRELGTSRMTLLAGQTVIDRTAGVLSRRGGRTLSGLGFLTLGMAVTIAGAGIGSAHLAKAGMAPATLVAGLLLIGGLTSLVYGSITLIRPIRGWWRLLALPIGASLLVFVLFPMTMAVNATNRPAEEMSSANPGDRGLEYRDVSFVASDGVRLSAWYVPSRNGAGVVLLHGAGSNRSGTLDHGVVLARRGYGVLFVDTRGHGLSGGHSMDFGWYGPTDIQAAVSFLARQPDVPDGRIAVVGISMGGEQAVAAAGSDDRIRAVVAEGVTGMQLADHGWLNDYGAPGSIQKAIDWVMYETADLLSGAQPPMPLREAVASDSPDPVLLIAGGATPDEGRAARFIQSASPRTVEVWVVPGAGHTRGLAESPVQWAARVSEFLNQALEMGD